MISKNHLIRKFLHYGWCLVVVLIVHWNLWRGHMYWCTICHWLWKQIFIKICLKFKFKKIWLQIIRTISQKSHPLKKYLLIKMWSHFYLKTMTHSMLDKLFYVPKKNLFEFYPGGHIPNRKLVCSPENVYSEGHLHFCLFISLDDWRFWKVVNKCHHNETN